MEKKKNISKGFVYKYISNLIKNLLYIKNPVYRLFWVAQ